jgi:pyridoxine/pyridoxamine 5'-phosphate oxidase
LLNFREGYRSGGLSTRDRQEGTFAQFDQCFQAALREGIPEPNHHDLSYPFSAEGKPSANKEGFTFFANHESRKSEEFMLR